MPRFRHKALAALLAFGAGALGADRLYLGQRAWWLALAGTAACLPWLPGTHPWYQSPAFFVVMAFVIAGFIRALVLALMPDAAFDARFNPGNPRHNRSGWGAVLVAIATMSVGAIIALTALVLLVQTAVERWQLP